MRNAHKLLVITSTKDINTVIIVGIAPLHYFIYYFQSFYIKEFHSYISHHGLIGIFVVTNGLYI